MATYFCDFLYACYDAPPLTLKNVTDDLIPYRYTMDLAAYKEVSPLQTTTKCVTSSSTSIDELSPLTLYVENPSSSRAAVDKRRRYVRGGTDWRHDVTSSFEAYGKVRMF